jgi:DNA adenine methylase
MDGKRAAFDKHPKLIAMYQELQKGWLPPETLTREEYYQVKDNGADYLQGFVGFGCSFSGKWWGGYAKDNTGRNYCLNARNSILKKMETMQDVKFAEADYKDIHPEGCLCYMDPPYENTTAYSFGKFDTDEFWEVVREWSKVNTVIVSEYAAPQDFTCVLSIPTKTDIRNKNNEHESRIEKLFCFSK